MSDDELRDENRLAEDEPWGPRLHETLFLGYVDAPDGGEPVAVTGRDQRRRQWDGLAALTAGFEDVHLPEEDV